MPAKGEKLTFQLVYQNSPDNPARPRGGKSSYRTMGSAMEQARFAIVSRRVRDPYSTVQVRDTTEDPPDVLMTWTGLDEQLRDLISIAPEVSEAGYDRRFFGADKDEEDA